MFRRQERRARNRPRHHVGYDPPWRGIRRRRHSRPGIRLRLQMQVRAERRWRKALRQGLSGNVDIWANANVDAAGNGPPGSPSRNRWSLACIHWYGEYEMKRYLPLISLTTLVSI